MTTPEQRREWQAATDAATPGECKIVDYAAYGTEIAVKNSSNDWITIGSMVYPDAKLYQVARTAMPALLAEVAALEAQLEAYLNPVLFCSYCKQPATRRCSYGRCDGDICDTHSIGGLCPACAGVSEEAE